MCLPLFEADPLGSGARSREYRRRREEESNLIKQASVF
jgi:hypothetical protein